MSPRPRREMRSSRTSSTSLVGPLGALTAATLRTMVQPQIHERGVKYADDGAVVAIAWRGAVLHAAVEGSEEEPYRVAVRRVARGRAAGALEARCTCPYMTEWDGWCKHVVAALHVARRDPAAIPRQPTVAQLLAPLERAALVRMLDRLVTRDPALYDDLTVHLGDADSKSSVTQ